MNPFLVLLLVSTLFLLSLFGAYIIFKLLKGRASFKHEGLNFGGSAAGFIVFFWLLSKVFFTALDKIPTSAYPPLEVVSLGQQGERILTEIALDPKKMVISLEKFKSLDPDDYATLSDSFNIAMAPPKLFNWSFGKLPEYTTIASKDSPFSVFMNNLTNGSLNFEPIKAQYFGARIGIPTQLILEKDSEVDGIAIGDNPFERKSFFNSFMELTNSSAIDARIGKLDQEELDTLQQSFISSVNKITKKTLPIKRSIYSGVYVTVYNKNSFKLSEIKEYISGDDLISKAILASSPYSTKLPHLSYLNGDEQIAAYSKSVRLKKAFVNGVKKDLIVNYVGFAINGDNIVYTVTLQYLSTDSVETLRELQRFFESARIVRPTRKNKIS